MSRAGTPVSRQNPSAVSWALRAGDATTRLGTAPASTAHFAIQAVSFAPRVSSGRSKSGSTEPCGTACPWRSRRSSRTAALSGVGDVSTMPGLLAGRLSQAGCRTVRGYGSGAPTRIRTWDLTLRRRPLYPAELPGPVFHLVRSRRSCIAFRNVPRPTLVPGESGRRSRAIGHGRAGDRSRLLQLLDVVRREAAFAQDLDRMLADVRCARGARAGGAVDPEGA